MKREPLISVLVPAYNVAPYVEEAIHSLCKQTYENIEIIIVDDHSTDDTLIKLKKLESEDSRIKIFSKDKNSGIVDTLNFGLHHCHGEYIARMDADDVAMEYRLQRQIDYLEQNPDIDIVGSSTMTMNMNGVLQQLSNVPVGQVKIRKTIKLFSPCFHIWLAKAKVYKDLDGYRALAPAEDYDFLLRASTQNFVIDNIPEPLMKVRVRDGNTADVAGLKQRKAHFYVINLYKQRLKEGKDSYNPISFNDFVAYSSNEKKNYDKSVALIKKGFMHKNKIYKLGYFIMASLSSKWQLIYSVNRVIFKALIK